MRNASVWSAVLAVSLSTTIALAQPKAVPSPSQETKREPGNPAELDESPVPLRVDIAIVRYQGEKRISRLPYTIHTTAAHPRGPSHYLRMGIDVPVRVEGKEGASTQYRNVGTNLDCWARPLKNKAFELNVSVEHSSLLTESVKSENPTLSPALPSAPLFRSFRGSFSTVLTDGRQSDFVAATDPISGDTIKVEVKLTVVRE